MAKRPVPRQMRTRAERVAPPPVSRYSPGAGWL